MLSLHVGDAGAVRVEYDGPKNALTSDGELEDERIGFSAVLPVRSVDLSRELDPPSRHPITVGATGLMLGHPNPMMGFPKSTVFSLYAVASNTGDEIIKVTPKFFYTQSGSNKTITLPEITLQPHEAKTIPVSEALAAHGLHDLDGSPNLSLSYTGKESELLATTGSVDQTGNYVLESFFAMEQETPSRTLCYWTLAGGTDTMYTVWNYTDAKQEVTLRLYFPGGTYEIPMSLEAGATQMVDLKELMMEGKPDPQGHQLPMDVEEGSAKLEAPGGDNGRMKLVVAGATYNVQTATCVFRCINCNGVSTYVIVPSPITLPIPVIFAAPAVATWNTGQTSSGADSWTSTNTAVATVDGQGNVSSVAPGSTNIQAFRIWPLPGQACSYNVPSCSSQNREAQAPTTATTTCFAQLKYRAVEILGVEVGNHSFWWFQDSARQSWITDAGPSANCLPNCGYLNSWITPGYVGHYDADDARTTSVAWASPVAQSICPNSSNLIDFEEGWFQDTTPYALGTAPNSNTWAHQAANAAPFTITTPPPNAPGW